MRIVLVGGSSFIARRVCREAEARKLDVTSVPHDAPLESVLADAQAVVNFAVDPATFTQSYSEATDWDLRVARAAAISGAWFAMCSTRRVYAGDVRIGARETSDASGDETPYGKNKAASERAVGQIVPERQTIFRLSNIFGFEYERSIGRRSFFGRMLASLRADGVVRFDMSAETRRDFLPVEDCARAILDGVLAGLAGPLNVGCGFPVRCGTVAQWVIEGFGAGQLIVETDEVRDEFFLDMEKWRKSFPPLTSQSALRSYCTELGRRLRNA